MKDAYDNEYDWEGKTILIVEDEEVSQYFFKKALKKTKAFLVIAKDGVEAVKMVKADEDIDLVLMDIRLPNMDGLEATRLIKQISPELPVVAQTAYAQHSDREQALFSGCDDYITKPIKLEVLLAILDRHLFV